MDTNWASVPNKRAGVPVPLAVLAEYRASKVEYTDYQSAVAKWEQQSGNKAESDSMKARLQRKQQEVQERENNRQSHHHKKDRGGR